MNSSFFKAVAFMLLSTLSFAFMNAVVKYSIAYPTMQIVFFRAFGSLVVTFSYLKIAGIPQWGNQKNLLIYRGIVGVFA